MRSQTVFHVNSQADKGARFAAILPALAAAGIEYRTRQSDVADCVAVTISDHDATPAARVLARFPIPAEPVAPTADDVRATLAPFYVSREFFNHKGLLDEMQARKGRKLTLKEQRDLGRITAAYIREREMGAK